MGSRGHFRKFKTVSPSEVVQLRILTSVVARRRELRELVENTQAQIEKLQKELQEVEARAVDATNSLESTKKELERALPFEKEVKEKNLLIGKLRHEAVILNDHLTKALRYLKKDKPEDTIDKSVGHYIHYSRSLTPLDDSLLIISSTFWLWKELIRRSSKCCRSLPVY